ncbi:ABC transporter substrate-binding protein [Paraburkholderia nemoris]|uniref:ABC transporter substrate-binding protein n=1 Tax=Paraburkholderia nemoris TaxID=2793076 RepID=UPI0038B6F69A
MEQNEQNLNALTVLGFEGAFNLPIWVGQKQRCFEKYGLEVVFEYVKGSVDMINRMTFGAAQVALTSVDNVLAYRGGQGETANGSAPDLVAFMGGDHGFLSLMAKPAITSVSQLRGKTLSVDALTTGFAFVLREILRADQMAATDVKFEAAGGTGNRYRELVAGRHDGTLVRTPFERLAQREGFNVLARGQSLFADYLGTVGAVTQSWASQNRDQLIRFILAYREALNWIFDANNQDALVEILRAEFVDLTDDDARAVLEDLVDPIFGLIRDMSISNVGLEQVSRIRETHAPATTTLSCHDCVDRQYLRMAQNSPRWTH